MCNLSTLLIMKGELIALRTDICVALHPENKNRNQWDFANIVILRDFSKKTGDLDSKMHKSEAVTHRYHSPLLLMDKFVQSYGLDKLSDALINSSRALFTWFFLMEETALASYA